MSFRPPHLFSGDDTPIVQPPEIQHLTPTGPLALEQRATIATEGYEQHPILSPCIAAMDFPNTDRSGHNDEEPPITTTATNIQRPPSVPDIMDHPPTPPSTHPVFNAPSALRTSMRPRIRLTWDVRYPPEAPPSAPIAPHRRNSTGLRATHSTRPRSNTHPVDRGQSPGPTLASDIHRRSNLNSPPGPSEGETPQTFTSHPVALEPATFPPRARMLIICKDLPTWLIPIYAHDSEVGCTVLDVVRGVYEALQVKVEVPGHSKSASDGTRAVRERRMVELLRDKTRFVCLERDEALARRCLPGDISAWEETFVLTLRRKK